jgi:hypothetical protein
MCRKIKKKYILIAVWLKSNNAAKSKDEFLMWTEAEYHTIW